MSYVLEKSFGALTKWIHWVLCVDLSKPNSQIVYPINILEYYLANFRIHRFLNSYKKASFFLIKITTISFDLKTKEFPAIYKSH